MQQYNMDFIDLMERLDALNESYKATEVSEDEEKTAKANYLSHLKEGYVDLEEFHKAFDRQIKEQGLEGLFQDDGSLLRYSYGAVKAPKNEIERAIKKLWVCVFSRDNPLPVGKEAFEEKQEREAAEKAERERKWAEWEAKRQAKEKAEEEERARISGERAAIADRLGLDRSLLDRDFDEYVFKTDGGYEAKADLSLDSLRALPEGAKLAAVAYSRKSTGRCYHDYWYYYSWNDGLIDGLKYFKLTPGYQGIFGTHTTAYDREADVEGKSEFLTGSGMNRWAEDEDELDSGD